MPTVLLINGYRFYFYAGDRNEPAHVHVEKADGIAKIWLEPSLSAQYFEGFKEREKREIIKIAEEHYDLLKAKWYGFFH